MKESVPRLLLPVGSPADKHPAEQSPRSGLSERVSMKLPAETFRRLRSFRENKNQKTETSFFFLPRVWDEVPFGQNESRPSQLQVSADSAPLRK